VIPAAALSILDGAWRFVRSPVVLGALAVFVFGQWQYSRGEARVRAEWAREREAVAAAQAVLADRESVKAAADQAAQERIDREHAQTVAAIVGDRVSLAGRLRLAETAADRLRAVPGAGGACEPSAAIAVAGGSGGADGRADETRVVSAAVRAALDAYDTACRLDAADRDTLTRTLLERGIVVGKTKAAD
jgi:hypothetical protein